MISKISLSVGSKETPQVINFELGHITIVVGPNNSGKSLFLRELKENLHNGYRRFLRNKFPLKQKLLASLEHDSSKSVASKARLETLKKSYFASPGQMFFRFQNPFTIAENAQRTQQNLSPEDYDTGLKTDPRFAVALLSSITAVYLDGQSRLSVVESRQFSGFQSESKNILTYLLSDRNALEHFNRLILDAFGFHVLIDRESSSMIELCFSDTMQNLDSVQFSYSNEAVAIKSQASRVSEFSDGVKVYTGIIASAVCEDTKLILIDEPEAFLHPPLVRKLGRTLGELASVNSSQVIAATHSADFLMGCIQSGRPVSVVRLTYRNGVSDAKVLDVNLLSKAATNPLLRASGILNALFFNYAIVCEGSSDWVLYEEINKRLNESNGDGIEDALFLRADGKSTIQAIVQSLRSLAIPTAVIVDLDIVKNDGALSTLLSSCNVPDATRRSLSQLRSGIETIFTSLGHDPKEAGIDPLDARQREDVSNFIDQLSEYGIFVVPVGRLEKWLSNLQANGGKTKWLESVLDKLGVDPASESYVNPSDGDIWEFVRRIKSWLIDHDRKGMAFTEAPISANTETFS